MQTRYAFSRARTSSSLPALPRPGHTPGSVGLARIALGFSVSVRPRTNEVGSGRRTIDGSPDAVVAAATRFIDRRNVARARAGLVEGERAEAVARRALTTLASDRELELRLEVAGLGRSLPEGHGPRLIAWGADPVVPPSAELKEGLGMLEVRGFL